MRQAAILALAAPALCATPALAAPKCDDYGPGIHIEFGFEIGAPYTDEEQEIFDKMALRQQGIKARTAKRTSNGCIEAWVPDGQGGFNTEYYDPRNFELRLD